MTKKKVTKLTKVIKNCKFRLRSNQIQYIIELCQEHPRWGVDKIFEEALKPRIVSSLIIPLTPKIKIALTKAAETYQLGLDYVTYHVLQEWLTERGFLKINGTATKGK